MTRMLVIEIPATPKNIERLSKASGIRISISHSKTELPIREAAEYCGYGYDHFRRLVIEEKRIHYFRPSGRKKGKIFLKVSDLDAFKVRQEKSGPGRPRNTSRTIHEY